MATTNPPRPTRFALSISDLDEAREFLSETYGGRLLLRRDPGSTTGLNLDLVDAGTFSTSDLTLPARLSFKMDGQDSVIVDTMLGGTLQADRTRHVDRYGPGDVFIGNFPEADYRTHTHNIRVHALTLAPGLLMEVASGHQDGAGVPRFQSVHPVGAAARRQWRATIRYATDLLANPEAAASTLVVGNTARLLAATALAVFPNELVPEPSRRDNIGTGEITLRRAVAFIDDHAHEDIGLADVAAYVHVTPRALQYAFRRHIGTTPMRYLRKVRLARAHQELLAADPTSGLTVTEVAVRWGFAHPGRFSAYYRSVYGVPPRVTLHA